MSHSNSACAVTRCWLLFPCCWFARALAPPPIHLDQSVPLPPLESDAVVGEGWVSFHLPSSPLSCCRRFVPNPNVILLPPNPLLVLVFLPVAHGRAHRELVTIRSDLECLRLRVRESQKEKRKEKKMGSCWSSEATGDVAEQKKRSQMIDRKLEEDSRQLRRECKILLLGLFQISPPQTTVSWPANMRRCQDPGKAGNPPSSNK